MDYPKILNIVRRFLWLFVLATLVASFATFFVLNKQPAIFEAKAQLLVGPSLNSPSPDLNSLKIGGQLIQTYAGLVNTQPFLLSLNNKLSRKADLGTLGAMIETRQNVDSRILTIIVHHQDPKQAVAIANAAAQTLLEMSPSKDNTTALLRTQMSNQSHQVEQIITDAETSIQQLEAELLALGNTGDQSPAATNANLAQQNLIISQLAEERARLSDALRTLATIYQVLLDTNTNQLEIIQSAEAASPVGQNLLLSVAAAGIAGLILAVTIVFAFEYFDDTIRVPGDFTRSAEVPLLSTINRHHRLAGTGLEQVVAFVQPKSRAANSYRAAVARLLFTIGEKVPYTFLLTSVGSQSGDDTATTTANLAVAFAQAGSRVVLVDAQFHNPMLTKMFGVDEEAGLADFLATSSTKPQLIPVKEMPRVWLLPAGSVSEKGPSAVVNSAKIVTLLEEIQQQADIILIAGSPISWFAESFTLASQVNSVILVARHEEAHSKIVDEVVENLRVMNVQLAGAIFDHNPSPFVHKRNLKKVSTVTRVAPKVSESQIEQEVMPSPVTSAGTSATTFSRPNNSTWQVFERLKIFLQRK